MKKLILHFSTQNLSQVFFGSAKFIFLYLVEVYLVITRWYCR